jgi:hypothetical protein
MNLLDSSTKSTPTTAASTPELCGRSPNNERAEIGTDFTVEVRVWDHGEPALAVTVSATVPA